MQHATRYWNFCSSGNVTIPISDISSLGNKFCSTPQYVLPNILHNVHNEAKENHRIIDGPYKVQGLRKGIRLPAGNQYLQGNSPHYSNWRMPTRQKSLSRILALIQYTLFEAGLTCITICIIVMPSIQQHITHSQGVGFMRKVSSFFIQQQSLLTRK